MERLEALNDTLQNLSEVLFRLDERVKSLLDRQTEMLQADTIVAKEQIVISARLAMLEHNATRQDKSFGRLFDFAYKVGTGLILAYLCYKFGFPR
jgi:hypothetical protein